jgi:hypothetical protein
LIVAVLVLLASAQSGPWNEIFVFDCEGNVHLFPSNDIITTSVKTYARTAANFIGDLIIEKVQCHCTDLTDDLAEKYFQPFRFQTILEGLERSVGQYDYSEGIEACGDDSFNFAFPSVYDEIQLNLPSSCSVEEWENNGECHFQFQLNTGLDFEFAFAQCDDTSERLPFISVSCSGDECDQLLRPCDEDADCDSGTCMEINANATMDAEDFWQNAAESWLGVTSVGFDAACSFGDSSDVGFHLVNNLLSYIAPFMGGDSTVNNLHFCGLDNLATFDSFDDFMEESFEDTCSVNDTEIVKDDEYTETAHIVTCSALTDWDGTMSSGMAATHSDRMDGTAFNDLVIDGISEYDDVYNIFHLSCESELAFMYGASQDMVISLPRIHDLVQTWGEGVHDVMECQLGNDYDDDDVRIRDFPWQPAFWMSIVTQLEEDFDIDFGLNDLWASLYSDYESDQDAGENLFKLIMPEGCTYEDWIDTGVCAIEWTGLATLIEEDVTLRLIVNQCEDKPDSALQVWFDCKGGFCDDVLRSYELEYCTQSSDCTDSSFECKEFGTDFMSEVLIGNMWIDGGEQFYGNELFFAFRNSYYYDSENVWTNAYYLKDDIETLYSWAGDSISISGVSLEIDYDEMEYRVYFTADFTGLDNSEDAYDLYYMYDKFAYYWGELVGGGSYDEADYNFLDPYNGDWEYRYNERTYYVCDDDYVDPRDDDGDCKEDDECDYQEARIVDFYNFIYTMTDRTPIASVDDSYHGYCSNSFLNALDEGVESDDETFEDWANAQYYQDETENTLEFLTVGVWSDADTWPLDNVDVPQVVIDNDVDPTDAATSYGVSALALVGVALYALAE